MTTMPLDVPAKDGRRWDLVALGEVMLRFDPGETRMHTARTFQVWEGGGEYNVARGLRRCFGLDTTIVTALAEKPPASAGYRGSDLVLWRIAAVDRTSASTLHFRSPDAQVPPQWP